MINRFILTSKQYMIYKHNTMHYGIKGGQKKEGLHRKTCDLLCWVLKPKGLSTIHDCSTYN